MSSFIKNFPTSCSLAGDGFINYFLKFDIERLEKLLSEKDEAFWQKVGEKRALDLFHQVAEKVPAYRDLLKQHQINPRQIKTIEDFKKQVPILDKKNYINRYSIEERSWGGTMAQNRLVAVSSGTSGEPSFWPRGNYQEMEASIYHELIYRNSFAIDKKKTLMVIGFPMGIYISGVATLLPTWLVSQRNYPLTIVSAGTNKDEILKVLKSVAVGYDQTILVGHPFFIKTVIEAAKKKRIPLSDRNIKTMFCSEGFSEKWRRYLLDQVKPGLKAGSAVSTYGTSEMLLMGHETPEAVKLKGLIEAGDCQDLSLENSTLSGVFQYNPMFRYVESVDEELIFTVDSGVPLIRFNLHDSGRVLPASEVKTQFEFSKKGWQLPFIVLGDRSDQTIIFYAANIYPDHIKQALDKKIFLKSVTGKFVMKKIYTDNMDQKLEINIELKPGLEPSLELVDKIRSGVVAKLKNINSEYLFLWHNLGKDIRPIIVLKKFQDPEFFPPGQKPKYIEQ